MIDLKTLLSFHRSRPPSKVTESMSYTTNSYTRIIEVIADAIASETRDMDGTVKKFEDRSRKTRQKIKRQASTIVRILEENKIIEVK